MSGSARDLAPVTAASLLAQYQDDPRQGLTALITRFNDLAREHELALVEKETAEKTVERLSAENQMLWRSLKHPRPSNNRQNSEGPHSAGGASSSLGQGRLGTVGGRKGSGSEASGKLDLPPLPGQPPRDDSTLFAASPSTTSLRAKAATPPPTASPRQHSISAGSPAGGRKASSLDLGHGRLMPSSGGEPLVPTSDEAYLRNTRTPPPPRNLLEQRERTSPRMSSSASMPTIASTDRNNAYISRTPERRLLPAIAPVSPLYSNHGSSNGGDSPRDQSPLYESTLNPTVPEYGLLPPQSIERRERDRTASSQSTGSSMGSASLVESSQLSAGTTRSNSSYQLSSPLAHSDVRESALAPRERRPSQPLGSAEPREMGPPASFSRRASDTSTLPPRTSASQPPQQAPSDSAASSSSIAPPRPTLNPAFLPFTRVRVSSSNIKINDKGKEIVTFLVDVSVAVPPDADPERQGGTAGWRVEKYYSDVLGLDSAVKSKTSRQESKSIGALPDKSLFKDHAPHKSDQRKAVLERYLQTLIALPLRDRTPICNFFNSDVVADHSQSLAPGAMEGWLTKRGRNFGGWQTRYYVLSPGTALSYYDTRNGTKLGEIPLVNAAIGRQSSRAADTGEDAYLHAFLIRTQNDKEQDADHILCAENDEARDEWVQALTTLQPAQAVSSRGNASMSFDRERIQTSNIPFTTGTPPPTSANDDRRPSQSSQAGSRRASASTASGVPPQDPRNLSTRLIGSDMAPSASMPANLDAMARGNYSDPEKRSTSAQGHHEQRTPAKLQTAERRQQAQLDRLPSPERDRRPVSESTSKFVASNVSGPMNAQPLPSGYEFKKAERQKKTKSSFWNFGARNGNDKAQSAPAQPAAPTRPVFGVPLKEAVATSRIRPGLELPAVVYRCVEYLEAKNAECEEGIFRLSGSANVIRMLKERFNAEGDVNLLTSNEYYDPHAIAGLLKAFLRELPVHLLTRELHAEFIQVIDLRNRRDRVNALGRLVAQLPIEEYTLFRFFFAHLCVIAQNAEISKMNVRNLGIVFSPTLAIPAPLFTLLLAEFDLVFAVEEATGLSQPVMLEDEQEVSGYRVRKNRNSELYSASGAALLMEGDATRHSLREQLAEDTDDDDDVYEEEPAEQQDATYLTFPSTTPGDSDSPSPRSPNAPPRSPGLPLSPRPYGNFSQQSQS